MDFEKKHSTVQAVMEVVDNIYYHSDHRELTMGIYIDLQKAFDTVNHKILLRKLENYGVRGTVLRWFGSYLANRKQYTMLADCKSCLESIQLGVPQGSVLGPLLFLIYVNDIQYAVPGIKIKLFADDTNLFFYHSNPAKLSLLANNSMAQLSEWFTANRLSLNVDKTCYSIFGPGHKNNIFKLEIDGKIIQNVKSCKYLGILIDSELNWQDHINYVYNKLLKFTSIFYKLRNKFPNQVLRMIYYAFVHSHLLYGIELYANTAIHHLSKLMVLNNKLLRILQQKSTKTRNFELYKRFSTLPLQLLHSFQILLFMHKYVYNRNELPPAFAEYFEENTLVHHHDTRQKNDFHVVNVRTETGKRSIKYKGCNLWNNLPVEIKNIKSPLIFRSKLKYYLRQSIQ